MEERESKKRSDDCGCGEGGPEEAAIHGQNVFFILESSGMSAYAYLRRVGSSLEV